MSQCCRCCLRVSVYTFFSLFIPLVIFLIFLTPFSSARASNICNIGFSHNLSGETFENRT